MNEPQGPAQLDESRNLLAVTLVAGHGLKHLYSAAFTVVLPEIKEGLALTNLAAGALSTSREISSGVATLPAGFLADRYSGRWAQILTISMALIAIGYLASGSIQKYFAISLAVILVGIGTSLWHPAAIASLSDYFPKKRGFALSLHGSGGSIGEAIGPLIAGGALLAVSWPHLLQWSFLPAALAAIGVWWLLKDKKGQKGVASAKEYFSKSGTLFRSPAFMAVLTLSSIRSMSHHIIITFTPIYLREDLEYSTFIVGVYVSLSQAVGIVTHPIMGFISDRYGRKLALVPGMIIFGLLCISLAFAEPGIQLVLTITAIGAFTFTFHAIFVAAGIDLAPSEVQGTAVALIYTGTMIFAGIGAIIGGMLADLISLESTFVFAGVIVIIAALALTMVRISNTKAKQS